LEQTIQSGNVNPLFYRVIGNYVLERRAFEIAIDLYEQGKKASADKVLYALISQDFITNDAFENAAQEYCLILANMPTQLNIVESKIFETVSRPGALDAMIKGIEDCADKNNLSYSFLLARLYSENEILSESLRNLSLH